MDNDLDLSNVPDPTADRRWRQRAVELAGERRLVGQAFFNYTETNGLQHYCCTSASEPFDHVLVYNQYTQAISCGCYAAIHGRPCAHAGATLLLIAELAEERPHTRQ
jgi:hypothetical protein